MIKMCDSFLAELRAHYPESDGLVSVSIKYPQRYYSGDVSSFNKPINYFTPSDSDLDFDDPESYELIRLQFNLSLSVKLKKVVLIMNIMTAFPFV